MKIQLAPNIFVTLPKALYHPEYNPGIRTFWHRLPIKNKHNIRN